MKVLIFIEQNEGRLKNSSKELLSAANEAGAEIVSVALGAGSQNIADLNEWGIKKHFHGNAGALEKPNPEAYLSALTKIFESEKPEVVLASSNTLTKDTFPRLAVRMNGAFMSDITELALAPAVKARRPLFAGKTTASVEFTDNSVKILLVRPNQLTIKATGKNAAPEMAAVEADAPKSQLTAIEKSNSGTLDLTEANVIISGGRGLKEGDNFKLLHDMAAPLHATVGASRAVVDLGWVPHSMQVGQTGKTVAPSLYIAAGISGAIQHLAGMSSSKVIVAINSDEKAPIFQKATYGLVGDVFQIAPALTEEFKNLAK
jgi:electron transfer flavoprotein alpha subunit